MPELYSELQGHIGRQLKAVYDDILSQPVPDRFRELLAALGEKESVRGNDAPKNDAEKKEGSNDAKTLRPR